MNQMTDRTLASFAAVINCFEIEGVGNTLHVRAKTPGSFPIGTGQHKDGNGGWVSYPGTQLAQVLGATPDLVTEFVSARKEHAEELQEEWEQGRVTGANEAKARIKVWLHDLAHDLAVAGDYTEADAIATVAEDLDDFDVVGAASNQETPDER